MSVVLQLIAILATGHIVTVEAACTKPLDLGFVLDSSSSICPGGVGLPCPEWDALIDFVISIADRFTIGPSNVRVGLGTISDEFKVEFNYNGYKDKTALSSAIRKLKFIGGEVDSLLSAKLILSIILNLDFGDRLFVPNVMIGINDGFPRLSESLLATMTLAYKAIGYRVITVCVTERCPESLAKATATDPKVNETYYLVDNYLSLYKIIDQVVNEVCNN